MIDHNHFICHFIFGGHLLNIPKKDGTRTIGSLRAVVVLDQSL
mgnify:CR=1 FL=1